jgi:hypothetical protein
MKKRLAIIVAALVLSVALLTACGDTITVKSISDKYAEAGYTVSTATAQTGVVESFGATKGTTVVSVYKFDTKASADAYKLLAGITAEINGVKISIKNDVYVCSVVGTDADAAIKIFDDCF